MVTTALLIFAQLALATPQAGGAGQDEPRYDTSSVGSVTGTVTEVSTHLGQRGTARTRVLLKTKDGAVLVHVGPTSFLKDKAFELAKGDTVTVIGSKVKGDAGDMVIVKQITRGNETLMMRDENGRRLWDDAFR